MKFLIYLSAFVASAMSQSNIDIFKASNTHFTADFFQEVRKEKSNMSVVMSAVSVLCALAQWAIVSRGPTRDEILKAIQFPNDTEVIKEQFANANEQLAAGSLYSVNNFYVREEFLVNAREAYNSNIETIDFSENDEAAGIINSWVENNTNHEIKTIVSPRSLSASTAAVLVNSVYFKLLEMPYEENQATFLAILPNKYDGISALVEKLKDPSNVSRAMNNMRSHEVRAVIPRFKIETLTDLEQTLKGSVGITDIFSNQADLSKITEDSRIYKAMQKASLDVTEKGSETAAANGFWASKIAIISFTKKSGLYHIL